MVLGRGLGEKVVVMRLLWNWLWFHAGPGRTWAQGDAAWTYPLTYHIRVVFESVGHMSVFLGVNKNKSEEYFTVLVLIMIFSLGGCR